METFHNLAEAEFQAAIRSADILQELEPTDESGTSTTLNEDDQGTDSSKNSSHSTQRSQELSAGAQDDGPFDEAAAMMGEGSSRYAPSAIWNVIKGVAGKHKEIAEEAVTQAKSAPKKKLSSRYSTLLSKATERQQHADPLPAALDIFHVGLYGRYCGSCDCCNSPRRYNNEVS